MARVQVFVGEWSEDTVSLYQAFNDAIADYAVENQRLGGPAFDPKRMTWVKPSFGWLLYRSGYGTKHGQNRLLKLQVPHAALAGLLSKCVCVDTNKATQGSHAARAARSDDATSSGRVQWDPERDLYAAAGREPREMLRRRAIQIGLAGALSQEYVASIVKIEDVTALGHALRDAHRAKAKKDRDALMAAAVPQLPRERPYMPRCAPTVLAALGMAPGPVAATLALLGKGKAAEAATGGDACGADDLSGVAHFLADATRDELPLRIAQLGLSHAVVAYVDRFGLDASQLREPARVEGALEACALPPAVAGAHRAVLLAALAPK